MTSRILVSLLYLGILIFFALRAKRRTHDIEDYYVGGRNIPTALVCLSFYATFVSTNSFIGHSAKSYDYGISWLIVGVILLLLAILSWIFIAPRFNRKAAELGSVVPSDMFRLQFDSPTAGAVAACVILFDSVFFLAAVFLGASEAMASLLGIPFVFALLIIFVVQLLYTALGGYLADVWSDSVQAIVLLAGSVLIPVALVAYGGGWSATWDRLAVMDAGRAPDGFSLVRLSTSAPLILIVGIGLSGGLKLVADPRQLSRFYGLRGSDSARRGVWLVGALVAVTYLFLLPIGLLARITDLPPEIAARTDTIVPWLLGEAQIVGPVLGAVFLTALLAAAMSTVDSVLLVAAGALQKDVLPLIKPGDAGNTVTTARKIVLGCAVLSLALAAVARANPEIGLGIVELTVFAGALYAASFLPGLVGILYWNRATAVGVILGMLAGAVSTAVWRFVVMPTVPALAEVPEVFAGVLCGVAAFVWGSLYGTGAVPSHPHKS
jgi:SSS family transporter